MKRIVWIIFFCCIISVANATEKEVVKKFCTGKIEYTLDDKTRVDCLTDKYAIEYDYARKWAECIGQAQYYALKTNKKPACALILRGEKDKKYLKRLKKIAKKKRIKVYIIEE